MADEYVYCTMCRYFRLCDEQTPYCVSENADNCDNSTYCVSENVDDCDNWNCEDSKPLSKRPYYEEREVIR